MIETIKALAKRPELDAPGTATLWDDPHISKGMLAAHLDKEAEGATRNHAFVKKTAAWIASVAPPQEYKKLLDLGTGPGIYAELFHAAGYAVTGVDISARSIAYAQQAAAEQNLAIEYICSDYLRWETEEKYDLITLIYCDFGALTIENQQKLLEKIYALLKPGGLFIFDVFTPYAYEGMEETKRWEAADGGYWAEVPYLLLNQSFRYEQANTVMRQHIVCTETAVKAYHVWEHLFTKSALEKSLQQAGFLETDFFGDMTGARYMETGETMCIIAKKE